MIILFLSRKAKCGPRYLLFCFLAALPLFLAAKAEAGPGIRVKIDRQSGSYTITSADPAWQFTGTTGHPLSEVKNRKGKDRVGSYHELSFQWKSDNLYTGSIRCYSNAPVVMFALNVPEGAQQVKAVFPLFTGFPSSLHSFSYADQVFAPHQFRLNRTSTPWLFFDDHANAWVLSPASDFMVSRMEGDGRQEIGSALNPALRNLPENFSHKTIMVIGKGIGACWNSWGSALRALYGRKRSASDADAVLKYYGYWTDNGADYYYNYDTTKGYANTLLAVRKRYRDEGIPLGYMQLDSWWYDKSIYDPDGRPDAGHKNKMLPDEPWNRYGGIMEYKADSLLFPHGLSWFQKQLSLPLVVHSRWIDPRSPYHQQYKITGYAAVDPAYWKDITHYLKSSGVVCYEQDWLNYIYNKTPAMASTLSVGNAFTDGMANACRRSGLDMQYCMLLPCFYLQGVKYANLTTIRTSDDRFTPDKWRNFIYDSQFAYSIGSWPWCDVFKSHETGNMIVAVLSAGAVGTGDRIGKEDKDNIMLACRNDGVLVKPDAPLVPADQTYIHDAAGSGDPMVGWTYTRQGNVQTDYVFAFMDRRSRTPDVSFRPAAFGMKGRVVVYNPVTGSAKKIDASTTFSATIGDDHYTYYLIAPVTSSGIAFLGDKNKIAATGRKRISALQSSPHRLRVSVVFAPGEKQVTLHGFYQKPIGSDNGRLTLHPADKSFALVLTAPAKGEVSTVNFYDK